MDDHEGRSAVRRESSGPSFGQLRLPERTSIRPCHVRRRVRDDRDVIHHADEALRSWFDELPVDGSVEVSFDPPGDEPGKQPKRTTISLVLSAVREQTDKRDTEHRDLRDGDGRVVARQRSIRWFELDYLCTVAGPQPRAHEVLGSVVQLLVDHDAVPAGHLPEPLATVGEPVEVSLVAGTAAGRGVGAGLTVRIVVPVQPTAEREIAAPAVELRLEMVPAPGRTAKSTESDPPTDTDQGVDPIADRKWTTVRRRERIAPGSEGRS